MKDPAFLFYTNDFYTGTLFFTDEQLGKYLRLLMAQHQHGHLTEKQMEIICKSYDFDIFSKFEKDEDGKFFNRRLEAEIFKRNAYVESRGRNKSGKIKQLEKNDMEIISKSYENHMVNRNRDINEEKKGKRGKGKKPILDLIPKSWPTDKFLAAWSEFAEIRTKKKKPLTENAISRAISGLIELSKSDFLLAEKIILQSVDHGWDSFYPIKNQSIKDFHHPVTGQAPPEGKGFDKRGRLWPVIGGRLIDEA